MLFNSLDFAVFLPLVFALYWLIPATHKKAQNVLLIAASYFFYGWWDWRFLSLIAVSTLVDYYVGITLSRKQKTSHRKALLWISIGVNLGILGYFKYYNFFLENFTTAFSFLGGAFAGASLKVILPVGISFYTFQTLSYTIDVYRKKLEPAKDLIGFAAFVCFFPQLVAGPIERATHLLPQFYTKRKFDYAQAVDGVKQILWGLFKKIVIADNCAVYVNYIFDNSGDLSGSTLVIGAVLFAFQIYGDFSGYSDIAIGTSRLFGFDLKQNFAFPYFSRDVAEFWRRWHISLSTWFRDYVYIPLGGSRVNTVKNVRNIFIVFGLSGFWHGANWTFIVWGLLNALYFLPVLLARKNRDHLDIVAKGKRMPSVTNCLQIFGTFSLTVLTWIFFRAENINHAWQYITRIFSRSIFSFPEVDPVKELLLILVFVLLEWMGREGQYGIQKIGSKQRAITRYALYYAIGFAILWLRGSPQEFIYFQF